MRRKLVIYYNLFGLFINEKFVSCRKHKRWKMNETATVLLHFFPQLSVNRTYFARLTKTYHPHSILKEQEKGTFSVMLTNNLFHRLQSVYLQRKLAGLCLYETNIYFQTFPKHVNDHILLASKKIKDPSRNCCLQLVENFFRSHSTLGQS